MKQISYKQLAIYLRNCVAFSFSWLVFLSLVYAWLTDSAEIPVSFLGNLFGFSMLASIEFTVLFSTVFIKKTGFIHRLRFFLLIFIPTELLFLYRTGIFSSTGTPMQWICFVGILLILYIVCHLIDSLIYKKQGIQVTNQLLQYQKARNHTSNC